jgi:hypothetical protein
VETAQRTGPEKAKASQDIDVKLKVAERLARTAPTGRNSLGVAPVLCGEPFRSDEHLQNMTPRSATGLIQVKVIDAKAR